HPLKSGASENPLRALGGRASCSVAHQPPRRSELTILINGWDRMTECQCGQLLASAVDKRVGHYHEATCSDTAHRWYRCVDFAFAACHQDMQLNAERAPSSSIFLFHKRLSVTVGWIDKQRDLLRW